MLSPGERRESGGSLEVDEHLRRRQRQALAGPDEERDARPAPGVDLEAHGREGLDLGVGLDARLLPVAVELAAHDVFGPGRMDRAEHLDLFVADPVRVDGDRRLHGEVSDDLEEMVLDDVADRAGLVVELAAPLHAELLGHRDLHAVDVVAVPDRLEERVGEAEEQEVLDGLLAQVVVDAEDRRLRKHRVEGLVERARRCEVVPEGLLDHDPGARRAAGLAELLDDRAEEAGRDRQVVRRMLRAAERLAQRREGGRVAVVAVDVLEQRHELRERGLVDAAAVLLQARARPLHELLGRPARLGDADDRDVEVAPLDHALERGKDLLVGQVAGRAEEDQGVGGHGRAVGPGDAASADAIVVLLPVPEGDPPEQAGHVGNGPDARREVDP